MSKLSCEDKIEIYNKRKNGVSIISLSNQYGITEKGIKYLVRLVNKHGLKIIGKSSNEYPIIFKKNAIDRVLVNNEPVLSVAIDIGLPTDAILRSWLKKYKENGYNIVERKRGRTTMLNKSKKIKKNETIEEEITRLRKENEYLKAEIEYSKKLRAVVQARKNQQPKKK